MKKLPAMVGMLGLTSFLFAQNAGPTVSGAGSSMAAATAAPTAAIGTPLPAIHIIGDSTAKNGVNGWGTPFANYFDPAKVRVLNEAIAARSSRSFIAEGVWDRIVPQLHSGDLVLLQFGHNDTGTPSAEAKGDRPSLPGLGEETVELAGRGGQPITVHTYGWYMRKYIADAKAKGAKVVVLAVTARDIWTNPNATFGTEVSKTATIVEKKDNYNPAEDKVERGLDDGHGHNFRDEAREIAKSQGVPFVDLTDMVADQYEKMGREKAMLFFPADHTHTNPAGADLNASTIVAGLKALKDSPFAALLSEKGKSVATAEEKFVADNLPADKPAEAKATAPAK